MYSIDLACSPYQMLRDLDSKLLPPRHHARLWGRGRSKAAGKRRVHRKVLKGTRWFYKLAAHVGNYGRWY